VKANIEEIKEISLKALQKAGLSRKNSETILNECLYGELIGRKSHGLIYIPKAVEKAACAKNIWKIEKEDDAYALINANGNFGYLVGKFAMELAVKKAKKKGISLVGMYNMHSYLMPGYYAKMASDKGMIGFVIDNSKSRVVPYGGTEPKLGPNPIGLSFPTKNIPFVMDMATSVRGMGEVRLAEKLNDPLPKGMALDMAGEPTLDPKKVHALRPMGGYKGYGLALGIEVLAGAFVRAKMGSKIKGGLDRGYLFIAIDPEIFVDIETFKEEVSELIKEIKACKKANGVKEILVPGEHAQRTIKESLKKGYLDVDENIIDDIQNLL